MRRGEQAGQRGQGQLGPQPPAEPHRDGQQHRQQRVVRAQPLPPASGLVCSGSSGLVEVAPALGGQLVVDVEVAVLRTG